MENDGLVSDVRTTRLSNGKFQPVLVLRVVLGYDVGERIVPLAGEHDTETDAVHAAQEVASAMAASAKNDPVPPAITGYEVTAEQLDAWSGAKPFGRAA